MLSAFLEHFRRNLVGAPRANQKVWDSTTWHAHPIEHRIDDQCDAAEVVSDCILINPLHGIFVRRILRSQSLTNGVNDLSEDGIELLNICAESTAVYFGQRHEEHNLVLDDVQGLSFCFGLAL